jgi:hypothetical protein
MQEVAINEDSEMFAFGAGSWKEGNEAWVSEFWASLSTTLSLSHCAD